MEIVTEPVGTDELDALASLFDRVRGPRRCWCTAFCTTRARFAVGWVSGGNRRRLEALAGTGPPVGVLAYADGVPVGWAACGPRSRYGSGSGEHAAILRSRQRDEDDRVWLLPCFVVDAEHRGRGVTHALVRAAVALARAHGATAIEAWPLASGTGRDADAFVGREPLFAGLGFERIDRPRPDRVVVRRELER